MGDVLGKILPHHAVPNLARRRSESESRGADSGPLPRFWEEVPRTFPLIAGEPSRSDSGSSCIRRRPPTRPVRPASAARGRARRGWLDIDGKREISHRGFRERRGPRRGAVAPSWIRAPAPSFRDAGGGPTAGAMSMNLRILAGWVPPSAPPKIRKSYARTKTLRPKTVPQPVTTASVTRGRGPGRDHGHGVSSVSLRAGRFRRLECRSPPHRCTGQPRHPCSFSAGFAAPPRVCRPAHPASEHIVAGRVRRNARRWIRRHRR